MTATTTKWTPSVQDASELWADGLAIASEIVNHGVHFCPFEIVRGAATGFSLPEIRTKTRAKADAVYLAIASDGYWHITDAVGDPVGERGGPLILVNIVKDEPDSVLLSSFIRRGLLLFCPREPQYNPYK